MRRVGHILFRIIVYCIALILIVMVVSKTLENKTYLNDREAHTLRYSGFYQMKKDTVDVLFFGSSHGITGFAPQVLYDNYGIRSYNLSSSNQRNCTSYYLLKEALKTQSPKVVVLDTYGCFLEMGGDIQLHLVTDNMRTNENKLELLQSYLGDGYKDSFKEYIFTPSRYHDRYKSLSENDFTWLEQEYMDTNGLKGFGMYTNKCGYGDFKPYTITDDSTVPMNETAYIWLEKITNLCDENGIELILVKTPTLYMTTAHHNAVQIYADANGLKFVDYNEENVYNAMDFDYANDMSDNRTEGDKNAHPNIQGAYKITDYIGSILATEYSIAPVYDEQYEESRSYIEGIYEDFQLYNCWDYLTYLDRLDSDRYTVFVSTKGGTVSYYSQDVVDKLARLGLTLTDNGADGYMAVISAGEVLTESAGNNQESVYGSYRNGRDIYKINAGDTSNIIINNVERTKNQWGLNIVVYSNERNIIIDTVSIDMATETPKISR